MLPQQSFTPFCCFFLLSGSFRSKSQWLKSGAENPPGGEGESRFWIGVFLVNQRRITQGQALLWSGSRSLSGLPQGPDRGTGLEQTPFLILSQGMKNMPHSNAQLRSFPFGSQHFPLSYSITPSWQTTAKAAAGRQTDRQLSKTHPWLPSTPARARAPRSAGKHGQGPAGVRSLAPPCPRRQQPWERKARTKMTFLLIQAIKNKVETRQVTAPDAAQLLGSSSQSPPAAGESPARACAGTAGEPSPGGCWHSGHIPHVQHFLLAFIIPMWLHSCWEGEGDARGGPVPAPLGITTQLQCCKNWDCGNSQTATLVALESQHPKHRGLCK